MSLRKTITLNRGWTFAGPNKMTKAVDLPHTWNNIDGQDGGIYRDVNLIVVDQNHFSMDYHGGPGIKVTAKPMDNYTRGEVVVETWKNCEDGQVHIAIFDADGKEAASVDMPCVKLNLPNVHLWNGREDPYLYTATATLTVDGKEVDQVSARFGVRDFFVDPSAGFFLNGRSYPLHGVSRHQDWKGIGNAITREHHDTDMAMIREVGANTIRLAHYQHDQYFYDLCDQYGMVVWAEIPYISELCPTVGTTPSPRPRSWSFRTKPPLHRGLGRVQCDHHFHKRQSQHAGQPPCLE